MKLARITVLAAALALFGSACGGGTKTPTSPTAPASSGGATSTTLTLKDNMFVPATLTLSGKQIILMNQGANLHNFSVEGQTINQDITPGQTVTVDVNLAPGTYTIFCKYHRALGMMGTLTVSG